MLLLVTLFLVAQKQGWKLTRAPGTLYPQSCSRMLHRVHAPLFWLALLLASTAQHSVTNPPVAATSVPQNLIPPWDKLEGYKKMPCRCLLLWNRAEGAHELNGSPAVLAADEALGSVKRTQLSPSTFTSHSHPACCPFHLVQPLGSLVVPVPTVIQPSLPGHRMTDPGPKRLTKPWTGM